MKENAKLAVFGIALYMAAKALLNLILDFGMTNISMLILTAFLAFLLIMPSKTIEKLGFLFRYANYITGVILLLFVVQGLSYNLTHLPQSLLYVIEGVIDTVFAILLFVNKDIKKFFEEK
jgi:hypothetical protein